MARFQIVFDAHDPLAIAKFWRTALRYDREPPPPGYDSWTDFGERHAIPREQWPDSAVDPAGVLPRLFFQPVPEEKVVKNRVHIDIAAPVADGATPDERHAAVEDEVRRLEGAGARFRERFDSPSGYWVVMQDPEGNEFCVQ
jgi:hypothetical protein